MLGLDTNVLVRYVTNDEPDKAAKFLEETRAVEAAGDGFFVSTVVLCELVWVLRGRTYGYGRADLAYLLDALLSMPLLEIQNRAEVRSAVEDFATGDADFADYLIGRLASWAGCQDTLTFDRRLKVTKGFREPGLGS